MAIIKLRYGREKRPEWVNTQAIKVFFNTPDGKGRIVYQPGEPSAARTYAETAEEIAKLIEAAMKA